MDWVGLLSILLIASLSFSAGYLARMLAYSPVVNLHSQKRMSRKESKRLDTEKNILGQFKNQIERIYPGKFKVGTIRQLPAGGCELDIRTGGYYDNMAANVRVNLLGVAKNEAADRQISVVCGGARVYSAKEVTEALQFLTTNLGDYL